MALAKRSLHRDFLTQAGGLGSRVRPKAQQADEHLHHAEDNGELHLHGVQVDQLVLGSVPLFARSGLSGGNPLERPPKARADMPRLQAGSRPKG